MIEKCCDVVVIGGGGSGLVAAVKAAEAGLKVIVLEKAKFLGGGMQFASTMRTFRSKWQEERGLPDQSNAFVRKMMDLTMWKLDPKLVTNAILGTGRFFDWYAQYEEPEVLAKYEARPYVFDIAVNGQPGPQIDGFHSGSGHYIMETMIRCCDRFGIETMTQTPAVDVEVENGTITAVLAKSETEEYKITCRACVLACSSWINRKEVVDRVLPGFTEADVLPSAHQNPAYTGDGIPIAEKVGAFVDWNSFCLRIMGPICALGDRTDLDNLMHLNEGLLVDLNAKRFVAEPMAPRMDPFDTGHVLIRHPKGKTFYLFSANVLEKCIEASKDNGKKEAFDIFGTPALPPLETINGWFREKMEKGSKDLGMADSVEELAEQIGLDPIALKQTVDAYNASCAEGYDWDFYKDPQYMVPFSEGPFYAIGGKLSTDGAFGGVRVNPEMQAYRPDGTLVDGLYVTGDFASGRHLVMDGVKRQVLNDMSWALSSGYLAGESLIKTLA